MSKWKAITKEPKESPIHAVVGINITVSEHIPADEIWFIQDGKVVQRIINCAAGTLTIEEETC